MIVGTPGRSARASMARLRICGLRTEVCRAIDHRIANEQRVARDPSRRDERQLTGGQFGTRNVSIGSTVPVRCVRLQPIGGQQLSSAR
jgi:hypothetical protein